MEGVSSTETEIYDVLHAVVFSGGEASAAVEVLKKYGAQSASVFADVLWMIGIELDTPSTSAETRSKVSGFVKDMIKAGLVQDSLLKERLEVEFLEFLGLISEAAAFSKKEVRVNTQTLYTQRKYNLFREESEGFSKLVEELNKNALGITASAAKVEGVVAHVKSIIGYFDLDPNRVLDVVLDSFENHPDNLNYFQLLKLFRKSSVPQVLGFKYQSYLKADPPQRTPASLYVLTARLIQGEFVTLSEIWPHMGPDDAAAQEIYDKYYADKELEAKKVGMVNLSAVVSGPEQTEGERPKEPESAISYPFIETENQKLGVLAALFQVGAVTHASQLLNQMANIEPCALPSIGRAVMDQLHVMIDPIYSTISPALHTTPDDKSPLMSFFAREGRTVRSEHTPQCTDFASFMSLARPLLTSLHFHLSQDLILMAKICRLCKHFMYLPGANEADKSEIEVLVGAVIFPSLSLLDANTAMSSEVWNIISDLHYSARYRLYAFWKNVVYTQHPALTFRKNACSAEARKILRRVTQEKSGVKQYGRLLGKVTHSNPLPVLDIAVEQIQAYDNMIPPVVESLKFLSILTYDSILFIIIERLSGKTKQKLKPDGTNVAQWLQNLALFTGSLLRRYSLDIAGLLQFLVYQLKDRQPYDIIVLKEMISKMSGFEYTDEMNDAQLEAQGGSLTLRQESMLVGVQRGNFKRSINRLRDAVLQESQAVALFVLLAHQRNFIIYEGEINHLKLIGDLVDKCHETLLQFTEFMQTNVDMSLFAKTLPTVGAMSAKLKIPSEVAFHIARPALTLWVKKPVNPDAEGTTSSSTELVVNPDLAEAAKVMVAPSFLASLSPEFYALFWGLSLYDIYVPKERYENEMQRKKSEIQQIDDPTQAASQQSGAKKNKERLQQLYDQLASDLPRHDLHVKNTVKRLNAEKGSWGLAKNGGVMVSSFIQHCVLPRCMFSPTDAVFCAHFARLMHTMQVPWFSTVAFYDRAIKEITICVMSASEAETRRLGKFLQEILVQLERYRADEALFNKECRGTPGFTTAQKAVGFKEFTLITLRWHNHIAKIVTNCLESKEYMEIRNGLLLLTKIAKQFPLLKKLYVHLEKRVLKIKEDERKDLAVLAGRYHAMMQQNRAILMTDESFQHITAKAAPAPVPATTSATTPVSSSTTAATTTSTASTAPSTTTTASAKSTATGSTASKTTASAPTSAPVPSPSSAAKSSTVPTATRVSVNTSLSTSSQSTSAATATTASTTAPTSTARSVASRITKHLGVSESKTEVKSETKEPEREKSLRERHEDTRSSHRSDDHDSRSESRSDRRSESATVERTSSSRRESDKKDDKKEEKKEEKREERKDDKDSRKSSTRDSDRSRERDRDVEKKDKRDDRKDDKKDDRKEEKKSEELGKRRREDDDEKARAEREADARRRAEESLREAQEKEKEKEKADDDRGKRRKKSSPVAKEVKEEKPPARDDRRSKDTRDSRSDSKTDKADNAPSTSTSSNSRSERRAAPEAPAEVKDERKRRVIDRSRHN